MKKIITTTNLNQAKYSFTSKSWEFQETYEQTFLRWPGLTLLTLKKGQIQRPAEGGEGELEAGGEDDGLILVFISPTLAPTPPSVAPTERRAAISACIFARPMLTLTHRRRDGLSKNRPILRAFF